MKRISFYETNRSGDILHIEVPGAIINIRVGLTNFGNHRVTNIEVLADSCQGEEWDINGDKSIRAMTTLVVERKEKQ